MDKMQIIGEDFNEKPISDDWKYKTSIHDVVEDLDSELAEQLDIDGFAQNHKMLEVIRAGWIALAIAADD